MKPARQRSHKGFTLIELAIALTIVALVIGGLAVPMSKRIAEQQYIDTQANIDKAMEAIVGFAILNRRLPCPDVNTNSVAVDNRDGYEDTAVNAGSMITGCAIGITSPSAPLQTAANYHSDPDGVSWGDVPWQSLGLTPPYNVDAWNNRLRYAVFTPLTTQVAPAVVCQNVPAPAPAIGIGFQNLGCNTAITSPSAITGGGQIDIRCGDPIKTTVATAAPGCSSISSASIPAYSVTLNAVVVVYSMGANSFGSTSITSLASLSSYAFNAARSSKYPDEFLNAPERAGVAWPSQATARDARRQFVVRARTDDTSASGAYDDLVSFMSASTLAAKLANAGVWP